MKIKGNKKKIVIAAAVIYLLVIGAVSVREAVLFGSAGSRTEESPDRNQAAAEQLYEERKAAANVQDQELQEAYDRALGKVDYNPDTAAIRLLKEDCVSLITSSRLPPLSRMNAEDTQKYLSDIKVFKRMENLQIDPAVYETPELNWKNLYNSVNQTLEQRNVFDSQIIFNGSRASELNRLIQESENANITVTAPSVVLDETIQMKSGIGLSAENVQFIPGDRKLDKAVVAKDCTNFTLEHLDLSLGGYDYALYIVESDYFKVRSCTLSNAFRRGLVLMGENQYFSITGNTVSQNGSGAVFLEGSSSKGILEENKVSHNGGTRNLNAGICLTSMEITDYNVIYDVPPTDEYLYDLLEAPHDVVLYRNTVEENNSSGVYSDGGYSLYILENMIYRNDKEGMCLDSGTFGAYVSDNVIKENGGRLRQSDADLEGDFIGAFGRLEDGSSPAKLPGISIDNAAYNTVIDNDITHNYGSGIKMVRSAYRNIIMQNTVSDNNLGRSGEFHFFGIEIGHASTPDQPVKGLDFTASYENIVCRNVVSGNNYSGIYLAEESYCNDVFDNVIMGSQFFSIECRSNLFNSIVNNTVDNVVENVYGG